MGDRGGVEDRHCERGRPLVTRQLWREADVEGLMAAQQRGLQQLADRPVIE